MSNRRVSELNEILASQVNASDLFLITDVSAMESKRIRASQVQSYALDGTASYAIRADSASYTDNTGTASFLKYNGWFNGSASYAISASNALSASWAAFAKSSSYAATSSLTVSASYASSSFWATTSSYALTASVNLIISSALSDQAKTASYIQYTPGFGNGTASYSLKAVSAINTDTASFLLYTPSTSNGTASYALTSSRTTSASFLMYDGVTNNGTASYAWNARSASNSTTVTSINNQNIYREFDMDAVLLSPITASFGWMQFTGSFGYNPKVIVEAWGDIKMMMSESVNYSGSLELVMENSGGRYSLDTSTFQYYHTGSSVQNTGSIICSFYLKGKFTVAPSTQRFSGSILAYNGLTFFTSSRGVQCSIKTTTDNFVDE